MVDVVPSRIAPKCPGICTDCTGDPNDSGYQKMVRRYHFLQAKEQTFQLQASVLLFHPISSCLACKWWSASWRLWSTVFHLLPECSAEVHEFHHTSLGCSVLSSSAGDWIPDLGSPVLARGCTPGLLDDHNCLALPSPTQWSSRFPQPIYFVRQIPQVRCEMKLPFHKGHKLLNPNGQLMDMISSLIWTARLTCHQWL